MSNIIPTAEQLAPLYAAAVAYGKASVRESNIYRQTNRQRTPALRRAGRVRDHRYKTMTTVLDALNAQFPGLALNCPAPYVGFTGKLDGYQSYVESRLPAYVAERWAKRHHTTIAELVSTLRNIPATADYTIGETVFRQETTDLCRVTHTTPKRRKILAVSLLTGKEVQLNGPLKRIDQALVTRLLKLHRSRRIALEAAGFPAESA